MVNRPTETAIPRKCRWRAQILCKRRLLARIQAADNSNLIDWGLAGHVEPLSLEEMIAFVPKTGPGMGDLSCDMLKGLPCSFEETTPRYDRGSRNFRFGEFVVHHLASQASNLDAVLRAFEDQCWCHEIFDPLRNAADVDAQKRLEDTARGLNHVQIPQLFVFSTRSDRIIRWDFLPPDE